MTKLDVDVFTPVSYYLNDNVPPNSVQSVLEFKEKLFMILVKQRHNITFEQLAAIKEISLSGCVKICWQTIEPIYSRLQFPRAGRDI